MTSLAVYAGLSPRVVGDLEEDEYDALLRATQDKMREESWTNTHEVLAAIVEGLWGLMAMLEAGIPTVMQQSTKRPREIDQYPRPKWVREKRAEDVEGDDGVVVVHHVADALRLIKGGKGGGA